MGSIPIVSTEWFPIHGIISVMTNQASLLSIRLAVDLLSHSPEEVFGDVDPKVCRQLKALNIDSFIVPMKTGIELTG